MKTKILLLLLLVLGAETFGQIAVTDNTITIDMNQRVDSVEVLIKKGKYSLQTEGSYKSIIINKEAVLYPELSTDLKSDKESNHLINSLNGIKLKFGSNTEYTILTTHDSIPKVRKYILRSRSDWSWSITFGANTLFYTNRSKFISQKADDGNNKVNKVNDQKHIELMPAIMFTFINNHENISPGFTGGLGVNFEEISVFLGPSLGIGQNIILTGGVAVHKQMRPSSNYFIGQTIDSSVTNDNLNESQYRINPFIGISFRLDKNPFKN